MIFFPSSSLYLGATKIREVFPDEPVDGLQQPRAAEHVAHLPDVQVGVEGDVLLDDLEGLVLDLSQLQQVCRPDEVYDVVVGDGHVARVDVVDELLHRVGLDAQLALRVNLNAAALALVEVARSSIRSR